MRLAWINYLRIFAAFGVVLIHASADAVLGITDRTSMMWEVGNICNASSRWTVPVFVMISGYFLLAPTTESAIEFYRRRFDKLLLPFLFSVAFFSLIAMLKSVIVPNFGATPTFNIDMTAIIPSGINVLKRAATGYPHYHLWYLYMILSLFFLTPFFQKIILKLSPPILGIVCGSLFAATFVVVSYLHLIQKRSCLYIVENTHFSVWFLPYLGYYFTGYYFRIRNFRPKKWILLLVFFTSIAITAGFCRYFASRNDLNTGLYFYSFTGITAVPMALSIFLWFKNMSFRENRRVEILGNLTFGIYLIHPFFQMIANAVGFEPKLNLSAIVIPFLATVVFVISAAVVYLFFYPTRKQKM